MIVIIDSGLGNIKSVKNAFEVLGEEAIISNKKEDLQAADKLVLPGVGTFAQGMDNLKELGLISVLEEEVLEKKKPFLGICLGMQLLATKGFEEGENEGLGWIPGEVKKLDIKDKDLKIPHMGWDNITFTKDCVLFEGIKKDLNVYFVHAYHLIPATDEYVTVTCDYGGRIVCGLQKENIYATQFHPEKSQQNGLKILENFIDKVQ